MRMTRFEAVEVVVFDNDGVLVDSMASVDRSWRRWAIELGMDPEAVLPLVHGRPSRETVASLVAPRLVEDAVRRIDAIEIDDAAVAALPGVAALLDSLPAGRWAIVTSASAALFTARFGATGLPRPAVVITADDVTRGKPDPEPYRTAMRRLGAVPARAAVLEDSGTGIAAAIAAGAGTIIRVGTGQPGPGEVAVVPDLRSVAWRGGLVVEDAGA